jgi:anti-anti-sigma factor
MSQSQRIQISDQNGTRVVKFLDRRLYDDVVVGETAEQLMAALPRAGKQVLILDFSGVESISSSMLVKLLLLQRQVDARRLSMRLCELSSSVKSVLQTTNLERLFRIDRDLAAALEAARAGSAT